MTGLDEVMQAIEDGLVRADLEWKLQFATHIDCECATYILTNRERVLPVLILQAAQQKIDPEDMVNRFVTNLHQRHLEGKSIFQ